MLAVEEIEEIDWWKWTPGVQEQIGGIDKQAIDEGTRMREREKDRKTTHAMRLWG